MFSRVIVIICACLLCVGFQEIKAQDGIPDRDKIAHDKQALIYKTMMWETEKEGFSDTKIPKKWEDESRVFLCKSYRESFGKKGGKLRNIMYYHVRIKLQDIDAVNDYSDFSFKNDYKSKGLIYKVIANHYVGFKIIKPDGAENEVDIDEAVEISYQQGRNSGSYNKIAIPNLEIGDIIDYYFIDEVLFPVHHYYAFDPYRCSLVDDFPIKKQYIELNVASELFLNVRSVNGAPRFKLVSSDDGVKTYELQDSMRDKVVEDIHFRMAPGLPHIKMQVYYINTNFTSTPNLYMSMLGGGKVYKRKAMNPRDLVRFSKYLSLNETSFWTGGVDANSTQIIATNKYLTENYDKKTSSKAEIAKEAFYFLRDYNLQSNFLMWASGGKMYPGLVLNPLDWTSAMHVLAAIYAKWKVPYSFIYTVPNYLSKVEDWLFVEEIVPMLEVCAEDTFLISHFSSSALINEMPLEFSGNKAYRNEFLEKKVGAVVISDYVKPIRLQKNTPEDLASTLTIKARIADFNEPVLLEYEYNVQGIGKTVWDTMVVSSFDEYNDANLKYYSSIISEANGSRFRKALIKMEEYNSDFEKKRNKSITNFMTYKLGVESFVLDSFYLSNIGRWEKQPNLIFGYTASVNDICTDVGNGYLFSVGSLLGNKMKPLVVEDSVLYDFQTFGPYYHQYNLTFTIPDDYQIEDVNQLETEFENECGRLSIACHYESDTLVVLVDRVLNDSFYSEDKWKSYKALMNTFKAIDYKQLMITKKE